MPPTQLGHGPGARCLEPRAHQRDVKLLLRFPRPLPSLLCDRLSVHLAAGACFTLHQITIHGEGSPSTACCRAHRASPLFRQAGACSQFGHRSHVMSYHGHGVVSHGGDVAQLTVPPGRTRLYGTVHDCIDCTGYDVRLAVSCRCLCPAWQDREPLHLQTPHFIIDTQRTPRAPALENFITQGPAMTSLWNAHPPGHMPTLCNTNCFSHARIERTDHRQRHSGSGLDVRMSQCNAMQCKGAWRWWKQTVSVDGTRWKGAERAKSNL